SGTFSDLFLLLAVRNIDRDKEGFPNRCPPFAPKCPRRNQCFVGGRDALKRLVIYGRQKGSIAWGYLSPISARPYGRTDPRDWKRRSVVDPSPVKRSRLPLA